MEKPFIAAKKPAQVILESGQYFWCACGKSSNQPFCDGSHRGSEFVPALFKIAVKQEVWLCQCKQTNNPPYCDGTHKTI
jgi:CDGSH iron-sulfur domain-containing protein 3